MSRQILIGLCSLCIILCTSCEGTSFQSSVRPYPVHVVIDTRLAEFVHFQPTDWSSYVIVNQNGYFYNGNYVYPRSVRDYCGYGGVLVFVSLNGYDAYDLACPYCVGKQLCRPCVIDGIYAVCAECGEHYELASGTAAPQKGIARETLRRLNSIYSDGKITISQRQ